MQQYPRHRAMAMALILVTGIAGFGGCATGPVTADDFASILAAAQDAFRVYLDIRMELQTFEAEAGHEDVDQIAELEAGMERALERFEYWRDRLQGFGLQGQKAAGRFSVS